MSFTIKQGDTYPSVTATLKDANGPVDLSSAESILFVASLQGYNANGLEPISRPAEVVEAEAGQVEYHWQEGDTERYGRYLVEFKVTWSGGGVESFPSSSYDVLEIKRGITV